MNDVQEKITGYLDGLESRLGKAEELVISEVPQFVSELLAYHWWWNLIVIAVCLVLAVCAIPLVLAIIRDIKKGTEDGIGGGILLMLIVLPLAVSIASCTATLLKISTAPRVYVVDYLRSEVQK
jgi:ABC-type transport system involved in cytochrome c biogenesis permease component